MCDRIPFFQSALEITESELNRLEVLLKKCKENARKTYKCYVILENIDSKKDDIKIIKNCLDKNIRLCNLYNNLDKELNELPNP